MDNGFRWLTVSPKGQPDLQIILMKVDGPNMQPEAAKTLKELLKAGKLNGGVLQTSDCRKTYAELKAKGVEFSSPPKEQFYGIEAIMKHNSGNWFSMTEPKDAWRVMAMNASFSPLQGRTAWRRNARQEESAR